MKNNHDLINHLESLEKDVSPKLKRKFNKAINRLVKVIGEMAPSISMPLSVSINTGGEELWLEWKNGYVFVNVISGGMEIECKSSGGEFSYFAPSFAFVRDEVLLAGMLGMKGKHVKK